MELFFGWLIFSFVAGSVGSGRNIGFWGAFLLSLIFSPLIGLIMAFASRRNDEITKKDFERLTNRQTEIERKARDFDIENYRKN